jgi:hypothetical protein
LIHVNPGLGSPEKENPLISKRTIEIKGYILENETYCRYTAQNSPLGGRVSELFSSPLSTAGEERGDQRSGVGVSRPVAMHLRKRRSHNLLTRSLLRSTTFSFAGGKEGKSIL